MSFFDLFKKAPAPTNVVPVTVETDFTKAVAEALQPYIQGHNNFNNTALSITAVYTKADFAQFANRFEIPHPFTSDEMQTVTDLQKNSETLLRVWNGEGECTRLANQIIAGLTQSTGNIELHFGLCPNGRFDIPCIVVCW
ncbi:MAG: hypothetical protein PHG02_04265 [Oscillospiraceae bacterium]|nr:hypothetical protein [Oscillospiraceae bacterium]